MNNENTFAFLIYVQEYAADVDLHPLPQAFDNVAGLRKAFRDSSFGIPKENIFVQPDPTSKEKSEFLAKLSDIIESGVIKNLIIYYAGHGILDDKGRHYLFVERFYG